MTLPAATKRAFDYFVGAGWSPAQSSGIVANLVAESNLNPAAEGDGGQAYGIAQWHPDRQAGFEALLGKPIRGSSLDDQLLWVHTELTSTEAKAGNALRACTTAAEAGACVSRLYERPADTEGEATRRGALAESILTAQEGPQATPAPTKLPSPQPAPTGGPMGALSLLPLIAQFIPQISSLIKPESQSAAKDAVTAQTILNIVAQVAGVLQQGQQAGAKQVAAAAEKLQADPELAKAAQTAVVTHPDILPLMEVGGGATAAREFDLKQQAAPEPFWKGSAVFWMSVLLLPLVYWLVGSLIVGGVINDLPAEIQTQIPWWARVVLSLFGAEWTGEARSGGFNLVIGLVLGGICGVYFGVSVTQQKQQQQQAGGTREP